MGRRSSGGGGFRSAPKVRTSAPKPAKKSSAPAPATSQNGGGSMFGSFGSAIADGLGWGVGTSMAHRAVDYVWGPRTINVVNGNEAPANAAATPAAPLDACSIHNKAFSDCINHNESDISRCQFYLDLLTQCRRQGEGAAATIA